MGDESDYRKANLYAGWVDVLPARKLANAISTFKLVLLGLIGLATVFMLGTLPGELAIGVIAYGLVAGFSVYMLFSWLEQTLLLLVGIAHNTAASAGLGNSPITDADVVEEPEDDVDEDDDLAPADRP